MRCSRLISMYVWVSGASDAVSFRSTNLIYRYCMSPCKIIHQTDLKCKWYNSDAASLTKIEHYPLSAWRPFFQIKSTKAARNDMKPSPKWYLESLSWCGSSLHKSIWSYRVRCGVDRRCSNTVAMPKKFKGSFWYVPFAMIFHNAGFWQVQPLPLICDERSRKSLNDSGACRRSWWFDILH